jgi:hypothetical protein
MFPIQVKPLGLDVWSVTAGFPGTFVKINAGPLQRFDQFFRCAFHFPRLVGVFDP